MRELHPIERTFRRKLNKFELVIFTSTQSYTASCANGTVGEDVEVERTATSAVSQADADAIALRLAREEAEADLVCRYEANACVVASCPPHSVLCRDGFSLVSQQDAQDAAYQAATEAARAACE